MTNIILTGHKGFIGSNIYNTLKKSNVENLFCVELDFYNKKGYESKLENIFKKSDFLIHVGANSDTQEKDVNKIMYTNYYLSKKLFKLANKYNLKTIYSSSAAVYGENKKNPANLYAWTKLIAEDFGVANNKNFVSLRYFNVYGPGEYKKGKMSSIAFQSFGKNDVKLFPGKPKRDFVYIDDVVSATIFPIFNNFISGIYEVGSGESRLFEDIIELMKIKYSYTSPNDIPEGYQFKTLAKKSNFYPGWKPEFNLERGIHNYLDYLRNS